MRTGDQVEWTNDSYIQETHCHGEVVHLSGEYAVVFRRAIAISYPQISPYVFKRASELRVLLQAVAA